MHKVWYAIVGTEGARMVVWGIGTTPTAARADAARWGLGDLEESCEVITAEQVAVVAEGNRAWPIHVICACECGRATGEQCAWSGPRAETVVVEWMPEWIRASHEAARNKGRYPHNGAERLRVKRSFAATLVTTEGEWAEIV